MSEDFSPHARFKDALFALYAASEFDQPLGRLRLQKLIYLSDILSVTWREVAKPSMFISYKNGPYDSRIQNAVDALVFRGAVDVEGIKFRNLKSTECAYRINNDGKEVVDNMTKIGSFHDDLNLFREIATEVNRRGWQNIKALVYAEPTYRSVRNSGFFRTMHTDTSELNITQRILKEFKKYLERDADSPKISRRNFVQIFFALLDENLVDVG